MSGRDERRGRQRIFMAHAGHALFRLACSGVARPIRDLSLEGFSMWTSTPPDAHQAFDFHLERMDVAGAVSGRARVVNYSRGATPDSGVAGCQIVDFDEGGAATLAAWLADHVEAVAAVPVTRDEACDIVAGPSLV